MSRVSHFDTPIEKAVRSTLHRMGYRFRLHRRDLPGNPDIVLSRHKKIIFVHGCFWHGVAGGSTAIKATYSGFKYTIACQPQPCNVGPCAATSCSASSTDTCNVQTPTFVLIASTSCPAHTCPTGYNNVPEKKILYPVLDQNGYAIQMAGMVAAEQLFNVSGTCSGTPTPSSASTDAYGTFTDHVWVCCPSGSSCGKSWNQSFTVNDYPMVITTGLTGGISGGKNAISTACTNGVGSCPTVSPTP